MIFSTNFSRMVFKRPSPSYLDNRPFYKNNLYPIFFKTFDSQISFREFHFGKYPLQPLRERIKMNQKMENYGKISSEAYSIWFPETKKDYEDHCFYKKFIKDEGQPALEVGCGNGRLLIPYLSEGLDVEGLDFSPYMIEICQKRAEKSGHKVNLYQQAMQQMEINKKFNTIFIPYGSFMLVQDSNHAEEALKRFYAHLNLKGKLLIPLFLPTVHDIHIDAPLHDTWRLRREGLRGDGATVKCWEKAYFDMTNQLENSKYRYEVLKDNKVIETEDEALTLRWYSQTQFYDLLSKTGFKKIECVSAYTDEAAKATDTEFTFIATK